MKKIMLLLGILALIGATVFYWWNNQSDIKALNENLPEGIKIEKGLFGFGKDYKIVNEIDGYEFKAPKDWKIITEVEYFPKNIEENYIASSIYVSDDENIVNIAQFNINDTNINLLSWVENYFDTSGIINNLEEKELNRYKVIKTLDFDLNLMGNMYFLKNNDVIYSISSPSESLIEEIIANGNW